MSLIHMENENYDDLVKKGIVLVDFYAEWCGPCKMLTPALEALTSQRSDVTVVKINVDEKEDLARRFGVMSVPTLILYKDGNLVEMRTGFHTLDMLNEWLESVR